MLGGGGCCYACDLRGTSRKPGSVFLRGYCISSPSVRHGFLVIFDTVLKERRKGGGSEHGVYDTTVSIRQGHCNNTAIVKSQDISMLKNLSRIEGAC